MPRYSLTSRLSQSALLLAILIQLVPSSAQAKDPALGTKLYQAVLFQDQPQLEQLLKQGGDPNYRENGRPLLGWAAQNGNVAIVEALLKAGANPNLHDEGGSGHTPLIRAIDTQQTEVVRALLKGKADPNALSTDGKSTLIFAVESRKPEIVQALVDAKVDLKQIAPDGMSPALAAAQDNMPESLEIIRLLGKAGANLNASNIIYTPLVYAIEQGNVELTKTLLEAGADPNAKTQSGRLPVIAALDNPAILELLVKAKADLNVVSDSGTTPLTEAIQNRNLDAVKVLLASGADARKADSSGRAPLTIAEENYQTEIAAEIKGKIGVIDPNANLGEWKHAEIPADKGDPNCTIVIAAQEHMKLHGELQAQVNAGKMSSDIFRTFNDDTADYGRMLTENPPEACALFARLRKKYGL